MIKEHDRIVLLKDLPEEGIEKFDVGTVVHVYENNEAYEVEFMTLNGETVSVVTLPSSDVRPVTSSDVSHTRERIVG
jgi:hypothetical protein